MTTPNDPTALRQRLGALYRSKLPEDPHNEITGIEWAHTQAEAWEAVALDLLARVEALEAERDGLAECGLDLAAWICGGYPAHGIPEALLMTARRIEVLSQPSPDLQLKAASEERKALIKERDTLAAQLAEKDAMGPSYVAVITHDGMPYTAADVAALDSQVDDLQSQLAERDRQLADADEALIELSAHAELRFHSDAELAEWVEILRFDALGLLTRLDAANARAEGAEAQRTMLAEALEKIIARKIQVSDNSDDCSHNKLEDIDDIATRALTATAESTQAWLKQRDEAITAPLKAEIKRIKENSHE